MVQSHEALLEKSGGWGKYQKVMIFLISLVFLPMGFTVFAPVFIYHMPPHRCYIPEVDGIAGSGTTFNRTSLEDYIPTVLSDDGNFELASCERYAISDERLGFNRSNLNTTSKNERETEKCLDGWIYLDAEGRTSVSTEFNLVCAESWKRPLLTSGLMIGFLFGSIVSGPFNDKFGRRTTALTNTVLNGLCIAAAGFSPSYEFMLAAIIIIGITHIILYASYFVLAQELVGKKYRATVACVVNIAYSCGYMVLPGAAYLLKDWRWIVKSLGLSFGLFFPYFFFLPESPRWLASKGRNMEAYKILHQIARWNGKDPSSLDNLKMSNSDYTVALIEDSKRSGKGPRRRNSARVLITNSSMRIRSFLICWVWNVAFLCYFALGYNTSNLGGNNYWNCFIAAAIDIPCHFFVTFSIQKFGRRTSVAAFIGLSGLFLAISPAVGAYDEATVTFAMVGKFFAASTVGILYLYTSELYHTLVRNTAIGMASMSSRISCMLAPFLIFAGENGNRFIPFYVMAVLGILTSVLALFLPETRNSPLPDTMLDAIAMDKNRSFPCIRKKYGARNESKSPLASTRDSGDDCKNEDVAVSPESTQEA